MPQHFWWFLARSSGITALALSGGAVIWGLLISTRLIKRRSLPKWLLDLHRFMGALSIAFVALHIAALMSDSYTSFGIKDVLVPMASAWHPLAVAWGIVAMYLLVIVEVTSLAMKRLPRKIWRRIHMLSFGTFGLSVLHGFTAGTDSNNRVFLVLSLTLVVIVAFLTAIRVLDARRAGQREPRATRPQASV